MRSSRVVPVQRAAERESRLSRVLMAATTALLVGGCVPIDANGELAELEHTHAGHAHPSVPAHAAHTHDASLPGGEPSADGASLVDVEGVSHGTLAAPANGRWTSLVFTRTDCPIANHYAPEIKRICAEYAASGVQCLLVYVDGHLTSADVREHVATFDYRLPAILDREHALVARAGATITPEAAVFGRDAALEYRGRIDNLYAELGRPRRRATEHDLRNALDDLVAGRPVRAPETQATGCYIE